MNESEQKIYDLIVKDYKKNIKSSWQSIMDNN